MNAFPPPERPFRLPLEFLGAGGRGVSPTSHLAASRCPGAHEHGSIRLDIAKALGKIAALDLPPSHDWWPWQMLIADAVSSAFET